MQKVLVFDLDGTLANLYSVENWLPRLRANDASVYSDAQAMVDFDKLNAILNNLRTKGWKIVVATWGSKEYNRSLFKATRAAKINWLRAKNFQFDHFHLLRYGANKYTKVKKHGTDFVIFDDDPRARAMFEKVGQFGLTEKNILSCLESLAG